MAGNARGAKRGMGRKAMRVGGGIFPGRIQRYDVKLSVFKPSTAP